MSGLHDNPQGYNSPYTSSPHNPRKRIRHPLGEAETEFTFPFNSQSAAAASTAHAGTTISATSNTPNAPDSAWGTASNKALTQRRDPRARQNLPFTNPTSPNSFPTTTAFPYGSTSAETTNHPTSISSIVNPSSAPPFAQPIRSPALPPSHLGTSDGHGLERLRPSRDNAERPLTIPISHPTSTSSLFSLEPIQKLLGEVQEDYFVRIEELRLFEPGQPRGFPDRDLGVDQTTGLLTAFFNCIHPYFPILDTGLFTPFFENTMRNGPEDSYEKALCLTILALGKLAFNRQPRSSDKCIQEDGIEYFSQAYHILSTSWTNNAFDFNLNLPTALILAAIYLGYLERPLRAWNLIHMASTKLQLYRSRENRLPQDGVSSFGRLCWTCFLLECDTVTEFRLPSSGIERVIKNMPFPSLSGRLETFAPWYRAIHSVRRLLNRFQVEVHAHNPSVAHGLFNNTTNSNETASNDSVVGSTSVSLDRFLTVSPLECVCTTLIEQLDALHSSLLQNTKPDLTNIDQRFLHRDLLWLRYWSTKHIICRQWLVYAATLSKDSDLPSSALKFSEICVESCRNYINIACEALKKKPQYTWTTVQTLLACVLVITLASQSSHLRHLVPDMCELLQRAKEATEQWASRWSISGSVALLLEIISHKQELIRKRA